MQVPPQDAPLNQRHSPRRIPLALEGTLGEHRAWQQLRRRSGRGRSHRVGAALDVNIGQIYLARLRLIRSFKKELRCLAKRYG